MKRFFLVVGAVVGFCANTAAAETPLMEPIHLFVDSFKKGDQKAAATAFAPGSISITDEIAPYGWTGPHAPQQWAKDVAAASAKDGMSEESITLDMPTREEIVGDYGYVVVPAVFAFKQKGAAMSEPAQMVYTLKQVRGRWLITSWTWAAGTIGPATATK